MREEEFTPVGRWPWSAHYDADTLTAQVIAPICGTEATGEVAWIGGRSFKGAVKANAHLIAAAPEMYEALDNIIDGLDAHAHILPRDIAAARAALSKARGET